MSRSLILALLLLAVAPAAAMAKTIDDRNSGYKLSVNSKKEQATLTIPRSQVGGRQNAFTVGCKKTSRGRRTSMFAIVEISPARKLRGPANYFPTGLRLCVLKKDTKRVATFKLR
jgi:hypothetical protein